MLTAPPVRRYAPGRDGPDVTADPYRSWGPLRGVSKWGDRETDKIFALAFFRVALRIGTKLEGVISAQDVAAQAHYVAHVEDRDAGVHRGGDRRGRGDAAGLIVDRQRGGAPLHWSVWTLQRPCRFVTRAGNVRLLPLSSVDSHNYGTHGDLRFRYRGRSWGSWKCRNQKHKCQPICGPKLIG